MISILRQPIYIALAQSVSLYISQYTYHRKKLKVNFKIYIYIDMDKDDSQCISGSNGAILN